MEWTCSECTLTNASSSKICVMCERGYQLFSTNPSQNESLSSDDEQDSLLTVDDELPSSSREHEDRTESDDEDSLLGKIIDFTFELIHTKRAQLPIFVQERLVREKICMFRDDGELLSGQQAADERKRSIARRKALDLQKLLKDSPDKSEPKQSESSLTFSKNVGNASAGSVLKLAFASKSKGHFNALTAHARGVNTSATATAEGTAISTGNAYATGANVSASASAAAVRVNAGNASATGANVSVGATTDGLNVAVGNVSATGVEVAASASASAARVAVGNVDVTGATAGASAKVNGAGITAGNIAIGGPSAAASVSVDGSLSFGNVNIGLRPSLDIGLGLNIGIPFLSGSRMGASGGGGNNNDGSNGASGGGGGDNPRGLEGVQLYLSEKYPNRRYYAKPIDVSIQPNTKNEPIDPVLPSERPERTDDETPTVATVVNRHDELVKDGNKFVGFKGGPRRDDGSTTQSSALANASSESNHSDPVTATAPTETDIWSGMYVSPSADVAAGYALDDKGRPGVINRVYLPENAADVYYTKTGLETPAGREALKEVKGHSDERYIFSGPQDSTQPDLRAPETVISPVVRDEALANKTIKFEQSAHHINPSSYRLEKIYNREVEHSQIVPDYMVTTKDASDCARDGGREQLGHVFQGRPPYGYENVPSKPKELSDDDKLLLEECRKLGFEISPNSLDDWKKKLKSNEEYEREEDAQRRQKQADNNGSNGNASAKKKEEERETEPPKPCKDHAVNVRCFKCMSGSSGPRIRRLNGQIHGFKFNEKD